MKRILGIIAIILCIGAAIAANDSRGERKDRFSRKLGTFNTIVKELQTNYVDTPDANIDFRRVPVLNAYFAAHAINLTTDTTDVGAWQGGDIVVYSNHIGIASDTRNSNGLPLLIHHVSAKQKQYEEDVLGTFPQELIGHYRIS